MKKLKNKKNELISWLFFVISALILYFIATRHAVFPSRYKFPLLLVILTLICISGIISILSKKWFRFAAIALNILLIVLMTAGLILLQNLEKRVRDIFKDTSYDEAIINIYATNSNFKENIADYNDPVFIIQKRNDHTFQ